MPGNLAAHLDLVRAARGQKFGTILADPPWQFQNRTGKVARLLNLDQPFACFKRIKQAWPA